MQKPDNKEYSKWGLMHELFEAKRRYYGDGKSGMTDQEYDALEGSIKAIHGEEFFKEWYKVGYDEKTHNIIKDNFSKQQTSFKKWFNSRGTDDS